MEEFTGFRFNDERSRRQVAIFRTREMPGAKDRNRDGAKIWTEEHREAWELEHIGEARPAA